MSYIKNLFVPGILVVSMVAGRALYQETRVGTGARDSSTAVQGDTVEVAFIANVVDGTVSLLDLQTLTVARTLDITPDGKRVAPARNLLQWAAQDYIESRAGLNYAQDTDISRDGRVLFVSRGFLGDVAAFDIASGDLLWRTPVAGLRADHMAISPDGKRLYVSTLIYSGNRVLALDTESGMNRGNFKAGEWPHDVHTSADGSHIYVASLGNMQRDLALRAADNAYRVTVAEAETLEVTRQFDFDAGVRPFVITRDKRRLYAQLSNDHGLIVHDLSNDQLLGRLDFPITPGVTEADWDFEAPHHGLALTADETLLCVAGRASDYAVIVSTEPFATQHIVPVGDAPSWAAIDSSGERCLLPNTRSDDVSVVSLSEGRELARVKVGRAPKHVTVGHVPRELIKSR